VLAYDYPLLGLFWTITIFFAWFLVVFGVIWAFIDNFRRHDHHGLAKALWAIFILFVPVLGMFIYLIARPADADVP
jgi:Phospholipase_D-nuclease N-terminal